MKKNIVIIYDGDDWNKKNPFPKNKINFQLAFEDWYERAEKYNVKFYRASIKWFNEKNKCFTKAWTFENGEWIKISKKIKPQAIFDKTSGKNSYKYLEIKMEILKNIPILNHPLFRIITGNKISQAMLFNKYMPKTLLVNNKNELLVSLKKIKSSQVVIKPVNGSGGFGIFIGKKNQALNENFDYPVIMQNFVKSTKGIPGFSKKNEVADLRLIYTNNKLVYALSRIAKEGSLFTNFHQGSSVVLVPKSKLPKSVIEISKEIVGKLSIFSNVNYSLDFMFDDNENPILIEMNTVLWLVFLQLVGTKKIKKHNFELFLKSLNFEIN